MTTPTTTTIGLFYGSSGGDTERAAKLLAQVIQASSGQPVALHDVAKVQMSALLRYPQLILGCPTWNYGDLQDDWDSKFDGFQTLDLSGRQVAVFGSGDQSGYPDTFQDALGILGLAARAQGAALVGSTPLDGYDFTQSRGVEEGRFLGLALDEDNQHRLTAGRVQAWAAQLVREFGLPLLSRP